MSNTGMLDDEIIEDILNKDLKKLKVNLNQFLSEITTDFKVENISIKIERETQIFNLKTTLTSSTFHVNDLLIYNKRLNTNLFFELLQKSLFIPKCKEKRKITLKRYNSIKNSDSQDFLDNSDLCFVFLCEILQIINSKVFLKKLKGDSFSIDRVYNNLTLSDEYQKWNSNYNWSTLDGRRIYQFSTLFC